MFAALPPKGSSCIVSESWFVISDKSENLFHPVSGSARTVKLIFIFFIWARSETLLSMFTSL